MNGGDAREAFNSLWSVTDKIFEHVADIRNLLNTTSIPVTGSSSDDPPSYESSTSEHLIDQLKERINCLEDLNKQRKLLYEQYANKRDACVPVENVHSEEKQQVWDKNIRYTIPEVSTPRDVAIRSLRSFLRSRQAALTANRLLVARVHQEFSALSENSFASYYQHRQDWKSDEEKKFYAELRLMALFSSQITEDQSSLLRDGRILEEKILNVPHDRGEEIDKLMKMVRDSYRQAEIKVVPTFFDLLLPIWKDLPHIPEYANLREVIKSIVTKLNNFNGQYVKAVESYQNSLQDLADLVVP